MVKVGDRVRYLNAVGGGIVVRIAKDIAYVDEDGFETPVLARECVVVEPGGTCEKSSFCSSLESRDGSFGRKGIRSRGRR